MNFELDYRKAIHLDAEDLAEAGVARAYRAVVKILSEYIPQPVEVREVIDNDKPSYAVRCGDQEYVIYSPTLVDNEGQSWGRATYAFFNIVNNQLLESEYRLYAINAGNDLSGMLLKQSECEAAQKSQPRKVDWPYLPTLEHPWYGQCHD